MDTKKTFSVLLLFLPISAFGSKSFLVPQTFPSSMGDFGFIEKQNFKIDDYEEYSGLSPYNYTKLVENEADLQDEVEEEEEKEEPENDVSPVATPAPSTQPVFCTGRNPNIPFGQKIPLGNPTSAPTKICSKYGWRIMGKKKDGSPINDPHYGIDIGCNAIYFDTPVYTTADGVVESVTSAQKCKSAGNYVKIRHDNGFITMYMHLQSISVKKGQRVYAGCPIGTMGHSGGAKVQSCPIMGKELTHLHYQIGYSGSQQSVTTPKGSVLNFRGLNNKPLKYAIDPTNFFLYH